jgi:folate-binding protein YgfZ
MSVSRLNRSLLRLTGDNVKEWLSGLVTNTLTQDMNFAALLTPQGKIIADFFVTKDETGLILDTPRKFGSLLEKRLALYKLRAPIQIDNISDEYSVYAIWGDEKGQEETFQSYDDPRHASLGRRVISKSDIPGDGDYNAHRLSLGVVESEWDFETSTTFPADANMDLMHGVDFKKGCFIGQEVVSRMKRMTTVKKRMRGVILEGSAQAGDKIMGGDRVIGELLSVHEQMGMAMIRLNRWKEAEVEPTINDMNIEIMDSVDGHSG